MTTQRKTFLIFAVILLLACVAAAGKNKKSHNHTYDNKRTCAPLSPYTVAQFIGPEKNNYWPDIIGTAEANLMGPKNQLNNILG